MSDEWYKIIIEKPITLYDAKGEPFNTFERWIYETKDISRMDALLNILPELKNS